MSIQNVLNSAAAEAEMLLVLGEAKIQALGFQVTGELDQLLSNDTDQVLRIATDLEKNFPLGLASQNAGKNIAESLETVEKEANTAKLSRFGILATKAVQARPTAPEEAPTASSATRH